jgi:hypothetical protein
VGGPQKVPQITNPQIGGLKQFVRFADLPQMWHFADLQFADLIFLVIWGFLICGLALADLIFFACGLKP